MFSPSSRVQTWADINNNDLHSRHEQTRASTVLGERRSSIAVFPAFEVKMLNRALNVEMT